MEELQIYRGVYVRPGTMDEYIVREVKSAYKLLDLQPGDRVLDIGANIGAFTKLAMEIGCHVCAIEPDPENFKILWRNIMNTEQGDCAPIESAVTIDGRPVTLYVNKGTNKGLHSTVPTLGRDKVRVHSIPVAQPLLEFEPTKIKIDCEGAEYEFLHVIVHSHGVKRVAVEYNLSRKHEQQAARVAHELFLSQQWVCLREPRFGTKAWATMAVYSKE